jgi:hypothetical protein
MTFSRYATVMLVGMVALAVLALAWPRLRASYRFLPVDIAIQRYNQDREIPSDRLEILMRFANEAIGYDNHYRYHEGLSLLHHLRAADINTPALERLDEYRATEAAAVASLQRAPAQPAVWMRLATTRWILHDEPETVVEPWKMSIFTGRTDSSLMVFRAELGLAYRQYLDTEAVAMLADQLLLAWRLQPGSLMKVLVAWDRELLLTRPLLENTDPVALAEMEMWLENLR